MSAAKDVYCGPSRGSRGGDSCLGRLRLEAVLAGEPLLAATGEVDSSLLVSRLVVEAEGPLGDLLDSVFLSTHSTGEGVFLDFLDFLVFLGFGGVTGKCHAYSSFWEEATHSCASPSSWGKGDVWTSW